MNRDKYLPVDPAFFDVVESEKFKNKICSVNYFDEANKVEGAKGQIEGINSPDNFSQYLQLTGAGPIRADRIITINGIPGPAYDEYDSYALACLTCMGGMD